MKHRGYTRSMVAAARFGLTASVMLIALTFSAAVAVAGEAAAGEAGPENVTAPPRSFDLTIGAAAGYGPVAKGVNAAQPLFMPHIEARLGRRVVVGTDGLAVRLVGVPRGAPSAAAAAGGEGSAAAAGAGAGAPGAPPVVRLTARLLPNLGRYDEHLPEDYEGIGDVPMTAEAGLDVGVRLWKNLEATGMFAVDILDRGHRGSRVAMGARWNGMLRRLGVRCAVGVDVVAATPDYMESYYGVSGKQASRTRFDTYDPGAGFAAARAMFTLAMPLGRRVTVASESTVTSFVGEARNSPLVQSSEQGASQLVLVYRL